MQIPLKKVQIVPMNISVMHVPHSGSEVSAPLGDHTDSGLGQASGTNGAVENRSKKKNEKLQTT